MKSRSRSGTAIVLVTLPFILLSFFAHLHAVNVINDDAFITYRYAANLASGDGLVYNIGERVLGTSTPVYAFTLGILAKVFGVESIPAISISINFLSLLIAALLLSWLGWKTTAKRWVALGLAGLTLIGPTTLLSSITGLESSFFLASLALSMTAAYLQRWRIAGLSIGLMPLIRPEGGIVLIITAVAGLLWLVKHRPIQPEAKRKYAGLAGLALAPGVAWMIFATRTYGSWLPHSVIAKSSGLYPIGRIGSLFSFFDWFLKGTILTPLIQDGRTRFFLAGTDILIIGLVVVVVLQILGVRALISQNNRATLAVVYVVLLSVFYASSGTLVLPHYHAMYEPFGKILLWAGLVYLFRGFFIAENPSRILLMYRQALPAVTGMFIFLPALILYPWRLAATGTVDPGELGLNTLTQLRYKSLAASIRGEIEDQTVILMPEIGVLGFYLPQVRVLDSAGLVSPEALAFFPTSPELGPGGIPPQMVKEFLPDMIIAGEAYCRTGLLSDAWFLSNYETAMVENSNRAEGDLGLIYLFVRNDYHQGFP